jgi:hypothetical protein
MFTHYIIYYSTNFELPSVFLLKKRRIQVFINFNENNDGVSVGLPFCKKLLVNYTQGVSYLTSSRKVVMRRFPNEPGFFSERACVVASRS